AKRQPPGVPHERRQESALFRGQRKSIPYGGGALAGRGARPAAEDPARAADRLALWRARHADHAGRYGTWAIEVRATGVVVGTVLLKPLPGRDESVPTDDIEVGWHLHPDSWGHGYATEAARAVVARELAAGAREVWAVESPGNAPSMAVARRLGMAHVGRRTDWYGGEELEAFVLRAGG
ncbi:GNAT family N-acetyltransferase, partial [Micromonospora olivasterospora]